MSGPFPARKEDSPLMAVKKASNKAKAPAKKTVAKKASPPAKKSSAPAKKPGATANKTATKKASAPAKKTTAAKALTKKDDAKKAATPNAAAKKGPVKKDSAPSAKETPSKASAGKVADAKKPDTQKTAGAKVDSPKATAAPAKAASPPKTLGQKRPEVPRLTTAGLDKEFLAEQKTDLMQLRQEYIAQAEEYEAEADLLAQELETGDVGFDEEAGEGGAATVDRERNLVLASQARQTATEIDDAVRRIEKGSYGLCLHCGQKIPKMRLKAIPHAELCVDCKAGGLLRRR